MSKLKLPGPHDIARRWNKSHPLHTPVRITAGKHKGRETYTISEAWVNSAGEPVIRLPGSSEAGVPLSSVEAVGCLVKIGD